MQENVEVSDDAFGYGINIALTVDSSYAMPAAVTMRSVVKNTTSKVAFYFVDCGLQEEDISRIRNSITDQCDATVSFLPLPERSLAKELGVT